MNTTTKHTPGPWEIRKPLRGKYRGDFAIGPQSHEGYNQDPAFCFLAKGRDDIQAANAALIAASPKLLELAEAFRSYLEDDSRSPRRRAECLEACRATIAEAKGEK